MKGKKVEGCTLTLGLRSFASHCLCAAHDQMFCSLLLEKGDTSDRPLWLAYSFLLSMHISPDLTQDYTYVDQGLVIDFSVLTRTVTICASSLEVEILLGSLSVPRWIILILSSPFSRDEIRSCLGSRIPKGYTGNPHGICNSQCAESSPFPRCWSSDSDLSSSRPGPNSNYIRV